jgi:hypothetical protein
MNTCLYKCKYVYLWICIYELLIETITLVSIATNLTKPGMA